LPAGGGVPAMQRINEVILDPVFLLFFFGTAVLSLVLLISHLGQLGRPGAWLACAGALLYLIGCMGVTMVFNVPLNNKLAAMPVTATDLVEQWQAFRVPWTLSNHVRTITCALAAAAFAITPLL
jgi:uncharacterized membrane protein